MMQIYQQRESISLVDNAGCLATVERIPVAGHYPALRKFRKMQHYGEAWKYERRRRRRSHNNGHNKIHT